MVYSYAALQIVAILTSITVIIEVRVCWETQRHHHKFVFQHLENLENASLLLLTGTSIV